MVNLIDCGRNEFIRRTKGKKLYCFGAGKYLQHFINSKYGVPVAAVIDNYRHTEGKSLFIEDKEVRVISVGEFQELYDGDSVVIITCLTIEDVLEQLDSIRKFDGMDCYVELFIGEITELTEFRIDNKPKKEVIPRKIHYCWFGGGELPEEYQKYIESWKKYCPDYEIIRWDESNYDIHKNKFVREAYENKKWAFVSDYARVDILYHEGGIYLDTDVEMVASFDEFLVWDLFCGFESKEYVAWGLGVGAVKGQEILKSVMDVYESMDFVCEDGTLDLRPCPIIQSNVLEQYGFKMNGQFQTNGAVAIYPKDFFAPLNMHQCYGLVTEHTHSIHHYAASWTDESQLSFRREYEKRINKIKNRKSIASVSMANESENHKKGVQKFQIWECLSDTNVAGSKAPMDIKEIMEQKGYRVVKIHPYAGQVEEGNWTYRRLKDDWKKCYEFIPENSLLLLQHPYWQEQKERNETLLKLKKQKHVKIISLVHDVENLRGTFLSEYMQNEFSFMLQIADVLIVHNDRMKEYFCSIGVDEKKIVTLDLFDYLWESKEGVEKKFDKSISIAGNLDAKKCPYIEKLESWGKLKVHLYGPNYEVTDGERGCNANIVYHGVFPSSQIPKQLHYGFGLIWDGDSLETCSGNTGAYLRYNNPHKLSLYLAAGIPVFIWKDAAEARFVEKNGVGIAIESIYEIEEIFKRLTPEEYSKYLENVKRLSDEITSGSHTQRAMKRAEFILGYR